MTPTTYIVPSEGTSPRFGQAFAAGCGGPLVPFDRLMPGPLAMFGSPQRWALLQRAIAKGRDWYYGDHSYFGRGQFYRVTRNAYQHDGSGTATPGRFEAFGRPVRPWRKSGAHVLICPNSPVYFALFGLDVYAWVREVSSTLALYTTRPIRVRWKTQSTPIASDLVNCWAVVTFTSAAGLDALIEGVPVITLSDIAATARMGSRSLAEVENPQRPDGREQFLWNLADQQWTLSEIRAGVAWQALGRAA